MHPNKNNIYLFMITITLLAGTSLQFSAQEEMGKGRINGTVLDQDGNPVEGAVIVVESLK